MSVLSFLFVDINSHYLLRRHNAAKKQRGHPDAALFTWTVVKRCFDVWCRRGSHVYRPGIQPMHVMHVVCQKDTAMNHSFPYCFLFTWHNTNVNITRLICPKCLRSEHTFQSIFQYDNLPFQIKKNTYTYLFPNSCHALYILLSFERLGLCVSFSSLSI